MTEEKPLLGDPESNARFDESVNAILAKAGVQPLSNPDRVKASPAEDDESKAQHEAAQRATGTAEAAIDVGTKPGLFQKIDGQAPSYTSPTGRSQYGVPAYQMFPGRKVYDTEIFSQTIAKSSFPWIGVLGSAQAGGHEVAIHLRHDPVVSFGGKVVNEPRLSDLDEVAAASIKTIKLERNTGSAPRRETTTILLADVIAVTVIEKIEKVEKKS